MRRGVALSIAAAATLGLLAVTAGQAAAEPGADCLWAGAAHAPRTTVVAGGRTFTCTTNGRGTPQWVRGGAATTASTVANPGAATRPAGTFSLGAQQPGTEYNDYCVGTQLVGGSEAVYEVVTDATGELWWKAAGPIAQWAFDPGTGPVPTTRSASLCLPDQPVWPELNTGRS